MDGLHVPHGTEALDGVPPDPAIQLRDLGVGQA